MIRPIVFYPDPVLRQVAEPVEGVTDEIRELASDMLETMRAASGVGLAAPQVGESLRLAIVDISHDPDCISYLRVNGEDRELDDLCPLTFINPEIEPLGAKDTDVEGCLSFPDLRGDITRHGEVKATLRTLDGDTLVVESDGLLSRAIQHETDHLFGKLFIDRMSSARKMAIRRQLKEMQQQFG